MAFDGHSLSLDQLDSTSHLPVSSTFAPSPATPPVANGATQAPSGEALPAIESDDGINRSAQEAEARLNSMSFRPGSTKRARSPSKTDTTTNMADTLKSQGAAAAVVFSTAFPDSKASDIWPELRNPSKLPARYHMLSTEANTTDDCISARCIFPEVDDLTRPTKLLKRTSPSGTPPPTSPGWPPGRLPTELYEAITDHLNRDDIKSMRLVCREFDRHVSQVLFKTVVVPFNTGIYGMLGPTEPSDGDENIKPGPLLPNTLSWMDGSDDDIYSGHGLDIFRGFGRHIRRFGMSFEVNEYSLGNLPNKSPLENQISFWGTYKWPMEEYCRFRDVAVLESTADETPRMAIAFSELTNVRELALSIDSGLGWLNGPDRSVRSSILRTPPTVFGSSRAIPDRRTQAQNELWDFFESCYPPHLKEDLRVAMLYKSNIPVEFVRSDSLGLINRQPEMPFLDPGLVHEAIVRSIDRSGHYSREPGYSILFAAPPSDFSSQPYNKPQSELNITPARLSEEQKEWLLETGWAQRAFLASYMLSVIDNHAVFTKVHTLNISRLSCCYLHLLDREDFWNALPSLKYVTLRAIADFRKVHKDNSGSVHAPLLDPSDGIFSFYALLRNHIVRREKVTQLTIGWETGGERAEGMFARNRLLLPAPVLPPPDATSLDPEEHEGALLVFPWVSHLTIENCWMTPVALSGMVRAHDKLRLKHLTLDSVSLTGVNVFPGFDLQHNQHLAHMVVGVGPGPVPHAIHNQLTQQHQYLQFQLHAMTAQLQWLQAQGPGNGQFAMQAQLQLQNQIANLGQIQAQLALNIYGHGNQQHHHHHHHHLAHNAGHMWMPAQGMAPGQVPGHPGPNPGQIIAPIGSAYPDPDVVLKAQPQVGSWLYVLDMISPGLNLSDFGSEHSQADAERKTSLKRITLKSCGYAVLPHRPLDIGPSTARRLHPGWDCRRIALGKIMLTDSYWRPLLGQIVQDENASEIAALRAAWGLETGWRDTDAAQGPEFDGLLPGGTGRYSGIIHRTSDIVG